MKLKNLFALAILAALLSFTAIAADHPTSLPQIQSPDLLRSYALKIAAYGGRYTYSPSMDWSRKGTVNSTDTNGTSGEDILKKLFAVPFSYWIKNQDDRVDSYAYLYDTNWNLLFYGNGNAIAKNITPTNGIHVNLWMWEIPILSDVSEANVLVLNEDGQTADAVYVQVRDGQLFWPEWLSRYTNMIVWVKYTDGKVVTYKVSDPVAKPATSTYEMDNYSVDGHYQLTTASAGSATLKILETYALPTAYLNLVGKQDMTIDVLGLVQDGKPYLERPYSMEIELITQGRVLTVDLDTTKPTEMKFPAGEYRIVKFNWTKFGQPQFYYTGGKG
ncbi:MAG: hypothetical protein RLY66_377 [Candidatus Parcubacteria bacterium]|jgi:hypothetical protein